jgi:hypothetical protein
MPKKSPNKPIIIKVADPDDEEPAFQQEIREEENKGEGVIEGQKLQEQQASISGPQLDNIDMDQEYKQLTPEEAENRLRLRRGDITGIDFQSILDYAEGEFGRRIQDKVAGGKLTALQIAEGNVIKGVGRGLEELLKKADDISGGKYNLQQVFEQGGDILKAITEAKEGFATLGLADIPALIKQSNAFSDGAFDVLNTIKAGFNMLNPITEGEQYNTDFVSRIGNDLTQSIRDEMKANGINGEDIEELINAMDANGDRQISQYELTRSSQRKDVLDVISKMDAATQMMVRNPVFRSQVIRRQNRQSIFGDDPYAKYNQIGLVQQAMASDVEQANLFNVNFGGE